ncbi:unnamed protein product [Amoebophrya sp. A25]|nr:unnamed protein product [Amoebophrya sp. A25]|eukprot:GSA25T00000196001.1
MRGCHSATMSTALSPSPASRRRRRHLARSFKANTSAFFLQVFLGRDHVVTRVFAVGERELQSPPGQVIQQQDENTEVEHYPGGILGAVLHGLPRSTSLSDDEVDVKHVVISDQGVDLPSPQAQLQDQHDEEKHAHDNLHDGVTSEEGRGTSIFNGMLMMDDETSGAAMTQLDQHQAPLSSTFFQTKTIRKRTTGIVSIADTAGQYRSPNGFPDWLYIPSPLPPAAAGLEEHDGAVQTNHPFLEQEKEHHQGPEAAFTDVSGQDEEHKDRNLDIELASSLGQTRRASSSSSGATVVSASALVLHDDDPRSADPAYVQRRRHKERLRTPDGRRLEHGMEIQLMVYADSPFQTKYHDQLRSLRCYARYWGYHFKVLDLQSYRDRSPCHEVYDHFFRRHCLLAEYMEDQAGRITNSTQASDHKLRHDHEDEKFLADEFAQISKARDADISGTTTSTDKSSTGFRGALFEHLHDDSSVPPQSELGAPKDPALITMSDGRIYAEKPHQVLIMLDADIAARNLTLSLDKFGKDAITSGADAMFFERDWGVNDHHEIMAGSFIVRNTERARRFVRHWAGFQTRKERPPGFSSSDNGAIHIAIPETTGMQPKKRVRECLDRYAALTESVMNMDPYFDFVKCERILMGMGSTPHTKVGQAFESRHAVTFAAVKDKSKADAPDYVIPGIRIRVLAFEDSWAPDWYYSIFFKSGSKSPLGHGAKDIKETIKQNWLQWKSLDNCEDFTGARPSPEEGASGASSFTGLSRDAESNGQTHIAANSLLEVSASGAVSSPAQMLRREKNAGDHQEHKI